MFYRVAWNCPRNFNQSPLQSFCSEIKAMGINAFVVDRSFRDWKFPEYTLPENGEGEHVFNNYAKYDRVYNVANDYGLKVFWYTGIEGLEWENPDLDNKKFIERYKDFAACGGWVWGDKLSYLTNPDHICGITYGHGFLEQTYNKMKTQDPDHPCFAVWGYNLQDSYSKTYSGGHGCDTYDIGCQCIRPYSLSEDPDDFLREWIENAMHMPTAEDPLDGFLDCGKGMIPVIQAYACDISEENPDWKQHLIDQYNTWKDYYSFDVEDPESSVMKGIGFYCHKGFGADCPKQIKIREGIEAVSTLTGWTG